MLELFRAIFDRQDVIIKKRETDEAVDRCLTEGSLVEKSLAIQLQEMKQFMENR
jgi:hypothetical protein